MAVGGLSRAIKASGTALSLGASKAALKALGVIAHSTLSAPLRSPTEEEEMKVAELVDELALRPVAAGRNGRS